MLHADAEDVGRVILARWDLPRPVRLSRSLPSGATADVWRVEDGAGRAYVGKLVYDDQRTVDQGLAVAEAVERATGIPTGAPIRNRDGALSTMTPSVRGLEHPLALLRLVESTAVWPGDGLAPEEAAELLARVHAVTPNLALEVEIDGFERLLTYVEDREPIAHGRRIRPALAEAVRLTRDLLDHATLTEGICYGDGPEPRRLPDGGLGLVDWGSVLRGPLLWDVVAWARGFPEVEQERFLTRYAEAGALDPRELTLLDTFDRLRIAWLLRFRAYRVAHPDHYDETVEDDAAKVEEYAAALGIALP